MIPWVEVATARAPEGDLLRLMRRGEEFSIRLDGGNELMNSRLGGSEEALAELALAKMRGNVGPVVLIGGLGMGFTLRAALGLAPGDARLEVAEIVPDLVAWARGPMAEVFGGCLDDARVMVRVGDVAGMIRQGAYDAILLDVDNGPDGLTRTGNDALYGVAGLQAARRALRPGGVLAIWSAHPDAGFVRRLAAVGFTVEEHSVRASRARRGSRHVIWIAQR